jgi:hypothetical protein
MLAKNANSFIEFDISYFTKNRSECWLLKIPMPIQIKKKKGFLSTLIIWTWPGFLKDCTNWMKLDSCYFYELVDTLFYSLNNLSFVFYWQVQAVLAENDVCFVLTEKTAKYHLCIYALCRCCSPILTCMSTLLEEANNNSIDTVSGSSRSILD